MTHVRYSLALLALSCSTIPALAQQGAPGDTWPPAMEGEDEEAGNSITVTGQRPRGSALGALTPELQLNAGDVRALGVSNVTELLSELAPQLGGSGDGPPLVLIEGHRVSSFREIAEIPAEAIARVEILPVEQALRYGYPPTQKVMNIVLRQRFRAITGEIGERMSTGGGASRSEFEFSQLTIARGSRFNLNASYRATDWLLEADRGITASDGTDTLRSLSPAERKLTVGATYHRPLSQAVTASFNAEGTTTGTSALLGPAAGNVLIPAGNPFAPGGLAALVRPNVPDTSPLARDGTSQSGHLGLTLNGDWRAWHATLTATYDHDESRTLSDRPVDLSSLLAALDAGDPAANPSALLAPAYFRYRPADITRSRSEVAATDLTVNGSPLRLPAGPLSATLRVGASTRQFASESRRDLIDMSSRQGRDGALVAANIDLPLIRSPSPWIGRISANGSAGVESLSDFGSIRNYGYGLNWTPRDGVFLSVSFRDAETAPTVQRLGDPQTITSAVPIFDYSSGTSVLARVISGGNPGLGQSGEQLWRAQANVRLLSSPDLSLQLDYKDRRSRGDIISLAGANAALQAAFPTRFLRDTTGTLIEVDSRPINIDSQTSQTLRWGLNFNATLKTPQSQIDAMRAMFAARFPNGVPNGGRPAGAGGPGAGFARGPGGPGGARGGRVNLSLYHTWHITEVATPRAGGPTLDLLDGATLTGRAGQPRHEIELRAGIMQTGLGARLSANWQSPTHVSSGSGLAASDLRFSGLTTVNLRLFANVGQMPSLVKNAPLLAGTRLSLDLTNIFDSRQQVTDGTGATPLAFRPGYLDPLGRTVRITIRKLFF